MSDKDWLHMMLDLKPGDRFELKSREGEILIYIAADPDFDCVWARPHDWDGDPGALVRVTAKEILAHGWRALPSDGEAV